MPREFTIIYEMGQDGWWIATIPEVPGAFSQGKTKDEARENVLDVPVTVGVAGVLEGNRCARSGHLLCPR